MFARRLHPHVEACRLRRTGRLETFAGGESVGNQAPRRDLRARDGRAAGGASPARRANRNGVRPIDAPAGGGFRVRAIHSRAARRRRNPPDRHPPDRAVAGRRLRRADEPKRRDEMKLQAPSSKLQRISKSQAPMPPCSSVGAWSLVFLWALELGIWSFPIVL